MIKRTPQGFKVTSEGGKNLSAPNLSHGQAVKRLEQVEYFRNRDAGARSGDSRLHKLFKK